MKRSFKILIFLVLVGAGVWFWVSHKPAAQDEGQVETAATKQAASVQRLSAFVDAQNDRIFASLEGKDSLMPVQELRQIRANFLDLRATGDPKDRRVCESGVVLCDQLLKAIEVRETHARRLADSLAKEPVSAETLPIAKAQDIQRKWKFFNDAILRSWEEQSKPLRTQVGTQYATMRKLEQ